MLANPCEQRLLYRRLRHALSTVVSLSIAVTSLTVPAQQKQSGGTPLHAGLIQGGDRAIYGVTSSGMGEYQFGTLYRIGSMALNHLAAAIIAFRKVPLAVNIIYG